VEWCAFELHPGIPAEGQPVPWTPEQRAARGANFARLADESGLEHGTRTHWYNSTPAHEAAEWATERGISDAFRKQIYRAYFVHDLNIGSPDVLAEIAQGLGVDAEDLRAALRDGRYRDLVAAQYDQARQVGVTAVPTFVAEGYALVGAHPYENFHKLMEATGAERRAGG
jgi:predicted DsbA family dithiol-disulfide isomerase